MKFEQNTVTFSRGASGDFTILLYEKWENEKCQKKSITWKFKWFSGFVRVRRQTVICHCAFVCSVIGAE